VNRGATRLDFAGPGLSPGFEVINDGVMGGLSQSRLSATGVALRFEGLVSPDNGGGFASMRGPISPPARSTVLNLELRGDGQRYKVTLRGESEHRYQTGFVASSNWQTLQFRADDFVPRRRGKPIVAPPLEFGGLRWLGLLISERQYGPFWVELRRIEFE